ncbi:MAG: PDZ domain-containing protein [Gemmatimonadota bacterium]|jgi:predicted metalloprotease with PDZ domain
MRRSILLPAAAFIFAATAGPTIAQESGMDDTIHYRLGWDNPASQLYTVSVTASAGNEPIVFSLPAWRPGRYIVQNYAANVQAIRAHDENGRPLDAEWIDLDSWRVEPDGATKVTLEYEYYASTLDAGSSTLRPDVAYFNPVNLFPWVEGRMNHPVALTFEVPTDWAIATQLERIDGGDHDEDRRDREVMLAQFRAPDYHRFVDSPTFAAPDLTGWSFTVDDVPYHVVMRGEVRLGDRTQKSIVADFEAMTREQVAFFGGAPFDEYWHLYQLVPYPFGHAVEHEASASYVIHDGVFMNDFAYMGFMSTTSHEFFHAWNVKRLRPAALWPYDYSTPQLTRLHWVTEGVTSYYDKLFLARSGVISEELYYEALGNTIRSLQRSPGRKVTSASLASLTSWHSGYGDGNLNQSISFYTKGSLLGLLIDLRMRDLTDGEKSLDDAIRYLWREYYEQGRGYPEDGVQRAVETIAGESFDDFFERYVHGVDELPYNDYLSVVGLQVREAVDETRPAATIGLAPRPTGQRVAIDNVAPDSPSLAAGLMRGDVLVSIAETEISTSADIMEALKAHQPGEVVDVVYERVGKEHTVSVTLEGGANVKWVVEPVAEPTERQLLLRKAWLASDAGR